MIFGIDFGTTNTVVALYNSSKVEYLKWDDGNILEPTQINGLKNIKRALAENSQNLDYEFFQNVVQFFCKIHSQIQKQWETEQIIECVLTAPARFDDIARNAIKSAAIAANFHVLKLITEPVAASLYAINNFSEKANGLYLVYDLGGGTFDVSLLNYVSGVFQVLAIDGLPNFGGLDIDILIANYLNLSLEDAKIYKESEEFLTSPDLKKIIENALQKTYEIVFELLSDQGVEKAQIAALILVGGSSRISMICKELSKDFEVCTVENPDYVVAAGAAVQGKWLSKIESDNLLIDAIPFNFGIETIGDKMEVMIPKNSALPYIHEEYFYPSAESVQISILQGVSQKASECIKLASFEVIQPKEKFLVTFMLDCDGILSVKIGEKVMIISENKMNNFTANPQILALYEKVVKIDHLSADQSRFLQYLHQAKSMNLSNEAVQWLHQRYEKLFH